MSTALYPMKFMPLFKNKVWGGNKIKSFGFDYSPLPNCGELWVLSGVEDNESVVENGFLKGNHINEVLEVYMGEVLGEENYDRFGSEFPLLLKLIDANDKLSIQVHPDDALAQKRGMENGKTEMWYILEAGEGAEIVDGFEQQVTPEEYRQYLEAGLIERLLHVEHPQRGDMFFIPAGRIHAIGKDILLAEIQQRSDCTYRIYRDTRFSKDKTPYKTHFGVFLAPGGKKSMHAGYYFHVGTGGGNSYPEAHMLASGNYCYDSKTVKVLREDISDGWEEFSKNVLQEADRSFFVDMDGALKKVPKEYPTDAPYADFMRLKSYCLMRYVDDKFITSPDLVKRVAELFRSRAIA